MLKVNLTLPKLNKIYIRLVSTGILAGLGLVTGVTPKIALEYYPQMVLASNAYAQEFTPDEIANYAKAGYEVELLRRDAYKEIKSLIDAPLPNIVCDRQETFNNLNPNVRAIAERYCNQSRTIVQQHNLSINRFNELKSYYDRREDFYRQVQNILQKLQN